MSDVQNPGQVNVVFGNRIETYTLEDGIETVGDAIRKFDENPSEVNFTVGGRKVAANSDLRDGDTILILSAKTASGGMKGARS